MASPLGPRLCTLTLNSLIRVGFSGKIVTEVMTAIPIFLDTSVLSLSQARLPGRQMTGIRKIILKNILGGLFNILRSIFGNAIFFDFVKQGTVADFKQSRSMSVVPPGPFQSLFDQVDFQ